MKIGDTVRIIDLPYDWKTNTHFIKIYGSPVGLVGRIINIDENVIFSSNFINDTYYAVEIPNRPYHHWYDFSSIELMQLPEIFDIEI